MNCIIKDCKNKVIARFYCWKHLQRWYRHKRTDLLLKVGRKKVNVCSCGKPRNLRISSAFCSECYKKKLQWYSANYRRIHPVRVRRYQQKCYYKKILGKMFYKGESSDFKL